MSKLNKYAFSELYDISSGLSSTKEQAGHGAPFASFSTVFNNIFLPEELPDLNDDSPDMGDDSGDVVYYGFEDPENDEYVLHLASCPLVQYRDMNDDRWAAYTEGSFDRDMYEMCDMCNP